MKASERPDVAEGLTSLAPEEQEMVLVPRALLLQVLETAGRNSAAVEGEFACSEEDHQSSREESDQIDRLLDLAQAASLFPFSRQLFPVLRQIAAGHADPRALASEARAEIGRDANPNFIRVEWVRHGVIRSVSVYEPQSLPLSPALADLIALALETVTPLGRADGPRPTPP